MEENITVENVINLKKECLFPLNLKYNTSEELDIFKGLDIFEMKFLILTLTLIHNKIGFKDYVLKKENLTFSVNVECYDIIFGKKRAEFIQKICYEKFQYIDVKYLKTSKKFIISVKTDIFNRSETYINIYPFAILNSKGLNSMYLKLKALRMVSSDFKTFLDTNIDKSEKIVKLFISKEDWKDFTGCGSRVGEYIKTTIKSLQNESESFICDYYLVKNVITISSKRRDILVLLRDSTSEYFGKIESKYKK